MIKVNLGIVDDDNLGASLRTASIINNNNDAVLQNKTSLATSNRVLSVAECAKTNSRNVSTGNMLYDNYTIDSGPNTAIAFVSASANYHLTSETTINLNNPTGVVAGKTQRGVIIAESPIMTAGSMWKYAGGTTIIGVPEGSTYDTYIYEYLQIDENIILLSFTGGIDGGI